LGITEKISGGKNERAEKKKKKDRVSQRNTSEAVKTPPFKSGESPNTKMGISTCRALKNRSKNLKLG